MQEVSDKVIVILVIIAVVVSVFGTFMVTKIAFDASSQGQNPSKIIYSPDNEAGIVSLVVLDDVEGGDSGGE